MFTPHCPFFRVDGIPIGSTRAVCLVQRVSIQTARFCLLQYGLHLVPSGDPNAPPPRRRRKSVAKPSVASDCCNSLLRTEWQTQKEPQRRGRAPTQAKADNSPNGIGELVRSRKNIAIVELRVIREPKSAPMRGETLQNEVCSLGGRQPRAALSPM